MQRIVINSFGPIPYCDLEVKDYMVFIGEQATGKSTICKCIYFFKSVRDEIKSYLKNVLDKGLDFDKRFPWSLNTELKFKFVSLFGMSKFKGDFSIVYYYNDNLSLEIKVTNDDNRYLDFKFCSDLVKQLRNLEEQCNVEYQKIQDITRNNFANNSSLYIDLERHKNFKIMENQVNDLFNDDRENFYIPAGRGLLSLLTNQLLNIELRNMDYITSDFMKLIQRERSNFEVTLAKLINHIEEINGSDFNYQRKNLAKEVQSILKGEYYFKDGKEYIRIKNRYSMPINFASSGQQEVLWILNLLFLWMLNNKKVFVVIEEPEAHLFPSAQKSLVDYITLFANCSNNQVLITTHSPYVLTSLNNLLYAGKVGNNRQEEVNNIISHDKWIQPNKFGAYMVGDSEETYIRTIIDEELQEIASEEIDVISQAIRSDYSKIFTLEANDEYTE